jgi:hypothetical protein
MINESAAYAFFVVPAYWEKNWSLDYLYVIGMD